MAFVRIFTMCSPTSTTSPPVTIGNDSNDDQIFSYIFKSKRDHPLPSNLRTDVNPFSIEPWRAPEKTWFLWNSEQSRSSGGHKVRIAGSGYWKLRKKCQKMFSSELNEGSKIYWEFYAGVLPCGRFTGWILLEYKKEPKEFHEDVPFSFSSLCTVYWQQINPPFSEAENNSTGAKDAEADHLQSILFGLTKDDEEENIEQSPANSIQVDHDDDQAKVPMSNISRDTGPEYSGDLLPSHLDGDFLELNDFDDVESLSSGSENSSALSKSSNEYFDSDALLLSLKNDNYQIMGEECKDQTQTSLGTTGSDETAKELRRPDAKDDHEEKPVRSSSSSKKKRGWKREKRAASRSPQSSGSSHGSSSNFGRRMAKYCCFGSP